MSEYETLTVQTESAKNLFQAGRLDDAIAAQIQAVKADPGNETERLFLFELLVFAGQWDRAARQLDAIDYPDVERGANVAAYKSLLDAERTRCETLASGKPPEFLIDPTPDAQQRVEALKHIAEGRQAEAGEILQQTDESGSIHGQLNGVNFELLRDCDDLFGTVLEVFSSTGSYFWVPVQQVASLTVEEPQQLRDLAWLPGTLELHDGPSGEVFLPVRYPNSHEHPDDSVRLARTTDWTAPETGPVRGSGARLYLVDDDAVALTDWRSLTVQPPQA